MMFRRAGAMRCNHIVLHHRGTSKEINGGGKGEVFPLCFWCLMLLRTGLWRSPAGYED